MPEKIINLKSVEVKPSNIQSAGNVKNYKVKVYSAINVYGSLFKDTGKYNGFNYPFFNKKPVIIVSVDDCISPEISKLFLKKSLDGDFVASKQIIENFNISQIQSKIENELKVLNLNSNSEFFVVFDHEASFPWNVSNHWQCYNFVFDFLKNLYPQSNLGFYGLPHRDVWLAKTNRQNLLNWYDFSTNLASNNVEFFPHLYSPYAIGQTWNTDQYCNMILENLNRYENKINRKITAIFYNLFAGKDLVDLSTSRIDYTSASPLPLETNKKAMEIFAQKQISVFLWSGVETQKQKERLDSAIINNLAPCLEL